MSLSQEQDLVAVVGMACRFPGATDVQKYWDLLCRGEGQVVRPSVNDLRTMGVPEETLNDDRYVPSAGLLDGMEVFDHDYFGIAPAEADAMDPQQRLFLQEAVHALEDAGVVPRDDGLRIGVFAGSGANRYMELVERQPGASAPSEMISNVAALPLRVSYHLGLTGPSVFVSSLCSTSLTAVHLARRSLLAGDCDIALAGAVALQLPQDHGYRFTDGGIGSPSGVLRPFDVNSDGTLPGSGVGIVVLKRMSAVGGHDRVHAVIRGSALNNDGSSKQSFAAPSVIGQRDVVLAAVADAGVDPGTIGFVEAHGTGTALGDPIELAALKEARARLGVTTPCVVGAVKSSVGHLDSAAGMAGLLKAILAVREGTVPATVGHTALNPAISLEGSGLRISARTEPWPQTSAPRRAAVTALGVGGTNAHVVLEAPQSTPEPTSVDSGTPQVLPVSAHSPLAFDRLCNELATTARKEPGTDVGRIASALQHGRRPLRLRRAWVCGSATEFAEALEGGPRPVTGEELVLDIVLDRADGPTDDGLRTDGVPAIWSSQEAAAHDGATAVARAMEALAWLGSLGVRPQALAARGAGVYIAAAVAGGLPPKTAERCVALHQQAVDAVETRNDLGAAEDCLDALERELATVPPRPLEFEVRGPFEGGPLRVGASLAVGELVSVTRSALLDDADEAVTGSPLDVLGSFDSPTGRLTLLARCWERGADVRWDRLSTRTPAATCTDLPLYPFDEHRHWSITTRSAADAVPAPVDESSTSPDAGPQVGPALAAIWCEVLGVSAVQPEDSFFDLGGHSLVASQVMTRIRERFGVRVSLGDLLEAETLAGMTVLVEHERSSAEVFKALTSADDVMGMGTIEL